MLVNLRAFGMSIRGHVTIGGIDVREERQRKACLQTYPMVFPERIPIQHRRGNIRFRFADVRAKRSSPRQNAHAAMFIMNFLTATTRAWEGGANLSGGRGAEGIRARHHEEMRRSVILDEADSVDRKTSTCLCRRAELTRGKTLVAIAHRLNTVRDADQFL